MSTKATPKKTPAAKKSFETRFGMLQVPETPTTPMKPERKLPMASRRSRKPTV